MKLLDRARLGLYVQRYDFWLDVADVRRRRRRALRHELRANLHDAAHDVGAAVAVANLGSPRTLARETVGEAAGRPARPHWTAGGQWAVATFVVLLLLWTLSLLAFLDGVQATGATGTVTGSVFPWGGTVEARVGRGLQVSASVPVTVWVLTLVAFVVGSRAWVLLTRRGEHLTPVG
ncbi:hypothetical protein ASG49_10575 [Marmoricola sp. Leaf446]|uniref:hypothetical protein n=1 Tax=Marmoricola sp. Leaf446 TaxID=1736379 RepID=UPI0006F2FAA6|nr:hypothetical protein [Marmoricola sp. Leaf446]KQT91467.1 hypothetical protein ASG49_10575 [Marmoricola sp. Leaf446]